MCRKIGKEITGEPLVALGAAHGCEFSTEDVQASAELSDAQMEGVAGGVALRDDSNSNSMGRHLKITIGDIAFGRARDDKAGRLVAMNVCKAGGDN